MLERLEQVHPVAGRMQCFGGKEQPLVVVDDAHTPDALEKALQTAREHVAGKLILSLAAAVIGYRQAAADGSAGRAVGR